MKGRVWHHCVTKENRATGTRSRLGGFAESGKERGEIGKGGTGG